MKTIDLATGVPSPAKAGRTRRNPKVGLLIEGRPEEPVVVIRARAAVRDRDIQSNAIRYLAETGWQGVSHGITWEQARLAITYWSRIIIENRSEEHTSELQSLMRISYAVFCFKKKKKHNTTPLT